MGNEVGQLHRQPRVAKKPQQQQGQGVARTLQEFLGWVKRPQEQLQATRNWAQVAIEPQEMRVVAQPLEAKVRGWLSHFYGWLNRHSHRRVAWLSCLWMHLPSTCPQTFKLAAC